MLSDFALSEILDFLSPWHPPVSAWERGRSRWQTWDAYLSDYEEIRAELAESTWLRDGGVAFAEQMRDTPADLRPAAHLHASQLHAHACASGDGHVHDGDLGVRLGPATEARSA